MGTTKEDQNQGLISIQPQFIDVDGFGDSIRARRGVTKRRHCCSSALGPRVCMPSSRCGIPWQKASL